MFSLSSVRTKNPKSRIPVAVTKMKTSSLKNTEKILFDKQESKIQTSHASKTINSYLLQKDCQQKCSQINESEKLLNQRTVKNPKSKQSSIKRNAKSNGKNLQTLRTNKHTANKREPLASFKTNLKTGISTNLQIQLKSNAKPNTSKKQILLSSKSKIKPSLSDCCKKSCDIVKEKLSVLKLDTISGGDTVEKFTPKDVSVKRNKQNEFQECFSAQRNIKFEKNEFCKNLILSNRELSPSICKFMPSLRASCLQTQRPSAYKKFEVPLDPAKEAFKAIEDARLSVKKSSKLSAKENRKPCSPFMERQSFYTPCADPREEVFRTLEEIKLKRLKKSTKKVTFNLKIEENTPKKACDAEAQHIKNSENGLTQINEKNEEKSFDLSQNARSEAANQSQDCLLTPNKNDNDSKKYEETVIVDQTDNTQKDICMNIKKCEHSALEMSVIKSKTSLTTSITPESTPVHSTEILLQSSKKVDSVTLSPNFICDRGMCEASMLCQRAFDMLTLEKKTVKSAKIYTPQPISLFSKSVIINSSSPEFLFKGKSTISSELAPICTPLVLRSIAKNNMFSPEGDLSPIRLKLDFTDVEKDTTEKETSKTHTLVSVENIVTFQKKQDCLADQECCILLENENTSIICGRYLANPVASTLSEGDDMHFIPIQP